MQIPLEKVPILPLLAVLWFSTQSVAQPGRQEAESNGSEVQPLALKEEMIRDRFARFEDRVFRLRERLSQVEPENVARLARVLQQAGELELGERLDEIATLLRDPSSLTDALDAQDAWLEDADRLLHVLLEHGADDEELADKIEGFKAFKEKLDQIVEQQRALREDTSEVAARPVEKIDDLQKIVRGQREVAGQTGALADDVGKYQLQGEQRGLDADRVIAPPGLENLDRAGDHMNDAAESLDRRDAARGIEEQDQAIEELQQARRELEEKLNQKRREQRERTLRDLESRFREMMTKQRLINDTTVSLDEEGRSAFTRAERMQLAELAVGQRDLSRQAADCLEILGQEGTTLVFPRVIEQMRVDMDTVADALAEMRVGDLTRQIEREIVDTLEQLLEVVQRMRRENERQPGRTQMGGEGDDPLLPTSAELKLLRASQLRVNQRTKRCRAMQVTGGGDKVEEVLLKALAVAAERQAECARIARRMRDRQSQE